MSNPDRLQREAEDHAEFLLEDRGEENARAWIAHCATRSRDGFWMRVSTAFERLIEEQAQKDALAEANKPSLDRDDFSCGGWFDL